MRSRRSRESGDYSEVFEFIGGAEDHLKRREMQAFPARARSLCVNCSTSAGPVSVGGPPDATGIGRDAIPARGFAGGIGAGSSPAPPLRPSASPRALRRKPSGGYATGLTELP